MEAKDCCEGRVSVGVRGRERCGCRSAGGGRTVSVGVQGEEM